MSEQAPDPAEAPPAPQPGFFTRELGRILPRAGHAGAGAAVIGADVASALEDHAGTILDVTAEAVALLKLADPADAALFSAIAALVPRVLGVAVTAKAIASSARVRPSPMQQEQP